MLIIATDTEEWTPAMVAVVIVGVLGCTALLAWMLWRVYRSVERAERDPRYLRRILLFGVVLYGGSALFGILLVITGKEPIQSLLGLPVVAALVWFYLTSATRVQVPPK
jgi:CDP-diglyceride synthetase